MRKFYVILLAVIASTNIAAQDLPISVKPIIWLKADSCSTQNNVWQDISGNNLHANCAIGELLPDSGLFNYNKTFVLSNTKPLKISYIPKSKSQLTIFTVFKATDSINELGVWYIQLDSLKNARLTTQKIKTIDTRIKYSDTTYTFPIINTSKPKWSKIDVDSSNCYLLVGGSDSLNFKGKFAEFLLFNTILQGKDLDKVHTYLAIKYGISLIRSDYVNSEDSVIWNYENNKKYSQNIAAIGKDTLLRINQKQAAANGGEDILSIAANNHFISNKENTAILNQGDFLIWSSNDAKINKITEDSTGNEISNLPERRWLMIVKGNTASDISTQLILDVSSIDTIGNCVLLINREGNDSFTLENSEIIHADSIDVNKKVYFSNINWDTDQSGSDMFTFLLGNRLTLLAEVTDAKSNGNNNEGKIKLEVIGGTPPFIYSLQADSTQAIILWNSNSRIENKNNIIPGKYLAKVIDIKGKIDTKLLEVKLVSVKTNSTVKTPELPENNTIYKESSFEVYPNPTSGNYFVNIRLTEISDVVIRVRDAYGKLIKETTKSGANQYLIKDRINEPGCYFIEIETNKERKNFKLVVN